MYLLVSLGMIFFFILVLNFWERACAGMNTGNDSIIREIMNERYKEIHRINNNKIKNKK